ncbi:hypothetical protein Pint_14508 [Pistacia integerrima]|uniref:Uncharacterized protein n=1 Tax=Pistacia integerrima TaxID=434235 RepID=A0ACC0YBV9_9ROSI|nr:hypothetical protein Pint_14508 [Pistacia integerrima]
MGVVVLSGEEAMEMELETEKNKIKKDGSSEVVRWERFLPRMVLRVLLKTTQAWFIRGPSTANSNDHQQKPLSLLADWNTYAFSQESDSSTFDLEATVRTTTDKVSGTFSVCDEFERLSGFSSLVALLVLTWSMLFLQNGGADEKLEDSGKTTSEIDLRVALGSGCVQWRRNHQLNSCLEDKVYVAFMMNPGEFQFMMTSNPLFELLALCGMLMDYNWIEILKRKELFSLFPKWGERDLRDIIRQSNNVGREQSEVHSRQCQLHDEMLISCSLNLIVQMQIVNEFQSFSSFMWGYVNYKPVINKYRYPRNVSLRTPIAEAISKDLLKPGFQFVGPVIVYSFMQAAKLTINCSQSCFGIRVCIVAKESLTE